MEAENGKYKLKEKDVNIAYVYYKSNGIASRIVFPPNADQLLKKYSFELRNVKENISEIGRQNVYLKPDMFIMNLEDSDQRSKRHQRSFQQKRDKFLYITYRSDQYNVTQFVKDTMRSKLITSETLASNYGHEYIDIIFDESNVIFYPSINNNCKLYFRTDHPHIISAEDRIRNTRNNVRFNNPVRWYMQNGNRLIASIEFNYRRLARGQRIFHVESELRTGFENKYREVPDRYKFINSTGVINIIGYKKRRFLWDRKIGEISLRKNKYWDRLSKELEKKGIQITKNITCIVNPSQRTIGLTYNYSENVNATEKVFFNLTDEFEKRFYIRPDKFVSEEHSGVVIIKGSITDSYDKIITLNEVKENVSNNIEPLSNCVSKEWKIYRHDENYNVSVKSLLNIPLTKSSIEHIITKRYDIMEDLNCEMINPTKIKCSFWGFERKH